MYLKSRRRKTISWESAPDVKSRLRRLISSLEISWVNSSRIFCLRSRYANTRAIARIWGLSKIWQSVLKVNSAYIVEVVSEKYDNLSEIEKDKVLLHEITHIPKNFSGSLSPHFRKGKRSFHKKVEILVSQYLRNIR